MILLEFVPTLTGHLAIWAQRWLVHSLSLSFETNVCSIPYPSHDKFNRARIRSDYPRIITRCRSTLSCVCLFFQIRHRMLKRIFTKPVVASCLRPINRDPNSKSDSPRQPSVDAAQTPKPRCPSVELTSRAQRI
jgi:hypothetical protein